LFPEDRSVFVLDNFAIASSIGRPLPTLNRLMVATTWSLVFATLASTFSLQIHSPPFHDFLKIGFKSDLM
jgi:hypothetical protein